ncbi:MAG: ATP-binding protein [Haloarculaceae archaeon]
MTFVLGRDGDDPAGDRPTGTLGRYRALDGSAGAPLHLDLDGPHSMLVVGKRGYGKSYTLGVVAESLARARGVAPVVVDPMGVFDTLAGPSDGDAVPAEVVANPAVAPSSVDPRSWCSMLGLSPASATGGLVWRAAANATTVEKMHEHVETADAPRADRRAADNYLSLASSWNVFDADGLTATDLAGPEVTVVDVSGLADAPMNAVVRAVGEALYRARVDGTVARLPWLLIDEAHTFFDGIARPTLETILTRGRAPGVSLVSATQRPSAVPDVGISQSDLLVAHRLTARADRDALRRARPTYVDEVPNERLPTAPGEVVIVDDATETVHTARIRRRDTAHGGASPAASDVDPD